jgi:hypothetical protein
MNIAEVYINSNKITKLDESDIPLSVEKFDCSENYIQNIPQELFQRKFTDFRFEGNPSVSSSPSVPPLPISLSNLLSSSDDDKSSLSTGSSSDDLFENPDMDKFWRRTTNNTIQNNHNDHFYEKYMNTSRTTYTPLEQLNERYRNSLNGSSLRTIDIDIPLPQHHNNYKPGLQNTYTNLTRDHLLAKMAIYSNAKTKNTNPYFVSILNKKTVTI